MFRIAIGTNHRDDAILVGEQDQCQLQDYLHDVQPHVDIAAALTDNQVFRVNRTA